MRLSTEKIKAAILDPDSALRTVAVFYFAGARSNDPSLMPLVIQAFERFGDDAFDNSAFLASLVQSDESIAWLCRRIDELDPDPLADFSELQVDMVEALCRADAALLERHAATIREVRQLEEEAKAAISNRIQLASLTPQALWQRLVDFCQELDEDEETDPHPSDFETGCSIVDALARYPEQFAGEVLKILQGENDGAWLETMAVRLAGAMRLDAATPTLIDLLPDFDSRAANAARWALPGIGTDSVVKQLAARFVEDEDLRLEIASLFENFYSDACVETCLELLGQEQDDDVRQYLIEGLLSNFASEGIEPARQFILEHEKTPELLEFRGNLLFVCQMAGRQFPELEAWREDATHDDEFMQAWYQEHGFDEFDDEGGWDDDVFDDDEFDSGLDGALDGPPAETVVRHDAKIGRNDPCPCGSGKKYKKCCLHKQALG